MENEKNDMLAGLVAHTLDVLLNEAHAIRGDKDMIDSKAYKSALAECLLDITKQRAECVILASKLRDISEIISLLRSQVISDVRSIFDGTKDTICQGPIPTKAMMLQLNDLIGSLDI
jgi:hypothetical protein